MSIATVLTKRKDDLRGRVMTCDEETLLRRSIPHLIDEWLISLMRGFRLIGTTFRLDEKDDSSGLGVNMRWLAPVQIVSESTEAYPGILAGRIGYIPIGMCLWGSGDSYFIQSGLGVDPPLVRIPHDLVNVEQGVLSGSVEIVTTTLSGFFEGAVSDA